MDNFEYCAPTYYVFGKGAELKAGELSKKFLGDKVLVVYGGGSAKRSGLLNLIEMSLRENDVEYQLFGGIQPNPLDGPVRHGIDIMRQGGFSGLLAVGGGSVIDTAKAIALGVLYNGDFWDFYCGKAKPEKALPVGTVLTIPAAGSEGSGNSVITLENGMKKISLRGGEVIRPKFSLMNPQWTMSLPAFQTACGICDMMAHILERYFTPTRNVEVTDRIAEGLLRAIMTEAHKVIFNPEDYQSRANIMWAGTMAHNDVCGVGRAQEWVSHGMEHEISALYGVTHGAGLAVVFPAYLKFMAEHAPKRVTLLARRVFDVDLADDKEAAIEGIKRLCMFWKSLDLPLTFAQLGVENPDIDALVANLHANKGAVIGGYYPLDAQATREIYMLCM